MSFGINKNPISTASRNENYYDKKLAAYHQKYSGDLRNVYSTQAMMERNDARMRKLGYNPDMVRYQMWEAQQMQPYLQAQADQAAGNSIVSSIGGIVGSIKNIFGK
ncbi:MAG: hypothetical protein VZR09_00260 [Candidatus Gastranaerophilaceae bacterium]|jgi:hypothetical protein|nr:hypothetical protein [Candidatus Gastranaerophilaceae bacterium]